MARSVWMGGILAGILLACRQDGPTSPNRQTFPAGAGASVASQTCTHTWASAVSGSWDDPQNWIPADVPSDTSVVCVTEVGSYTITLDRSGATPPVAVRLAGLLIDPQSGHAALQLSGASTTLDVSGGGTIGAFGELSLNGGSSDSLHLTGGGGLSVSGTLSTSGGTDALLSLSLNLTNTGTLSIGANTEFDAPGTTLTQDGVITIAGSSQLTVTAGANITTSASSSINGTLRLRGSALSGGGSVEHLVAEGGSVVEPGLPVGTLGVGSYLQDATSTLRMDINGIAGNGDIDALAASGDVSIAGTLDLITNAAFVGGTCGQVAPLVTSAATLAGGFTSITGTSLAIDREWRLHTTGSSVQLVGFDPTRVIGVNPTPTAVLEGGSDVSYSVCLGPTPSADVTVDVVADAQLTVSASQLLYPLASWSLPQTFAVGAVDDAVYEGPHSGVLTHTATSADPTYAGAQFNLTLSIGDNDQAPPVAVNDVAATAEDTPLAVDVLANDSDPDSPTLTISAMGSATHGILSLMPDGRTIQYAPAADFWGSDSFSYTVTDGAGATAIGTVTVQVTPVEDLPVAVADQATLAEDTPTTISALANDRDVDGDPLVILAVTAPAHGSATISADSTQIIYVPSANYYGSDAVSYTVRDSAGGTANATVLLDVTSVNDAPSGTADAASTVGPNAVAFNVLSNDSDVDGDALVVASVSSPPNGTVTVGIGGSLAYTPVFGFTGQDAFTYVLDDGHGASVTVPVTLTVTRPINWPPQVVADLATTWRDWTLVVPVTTNDSDLDQDAIRLTSVSTSLNAVTGIFHNQVTYDPNTVFVGTDVVMYSVSDGKGHSASTTVTFSVLPTPPNADAYITVTASITPGTPSIVTFTITEGNKGPNTAVAEYVRVPVTPGWTFLDSPGNRCAAAPAGAMCDRPSLAPGATRVFTMPFQVLKGTYTISVIQTLPNTDPVKSNNTVKLTVVVP